MGVVALSVCSLFLLSAFCAGGFVVGRLSELSLLILSLFLFCDVVFFLISISLIRWGLFSAIVTENSGY